MLKLSDLMFQPDLLVLLFIHHRHGHHACRAMLRQARDAGSLDLDEVFEDNKEAARLLISGTLT